VGKEGTIEVERNTQHDGTSKKKKHLGKRKLVPKVGTKNKSRRIRGGGGTSWGGFKGEGPAREGKLREEVAWTVGGAYSHLLRSSGEGGKVMHRFQSPRGGSSACLGKLFHYPTSPLE